MAGSLGTGLMVTLMSIGAKWIQSSFLKKRGKVVAQRQAVAAGVDLAFMVVTAFIIIAFICSFLFKKRLPIAVNYKI